MRTEFKIIQLKRNPQDELVVEMVVITWVEEALGAEKIAKIESVKLASLQARVDKINNPEFLLGKPWSDFRFNFGRLLK